jgi:hypothetical protein
MEDIDYLHTSVAFFPGHTRGIHREGWRVALCVVTFGGRKYLLPFPGTEPRIVEPDAFVLYLMSYGVLVMLMLVVLTHRYIEVPFS